MADENLFGNPATKQNGQFFQHAVFVFADVVVLGQLPRHAQRPATRHDGDLVHRVGLGQRHRHHGVARLVIRGVAALVFAHDHAAPFRTHVNLVLGVFKITHVHLLLVAARRKQRSFVDQIGQICTREARRAACQHISAHIVVQRHLAHMHFQDLLAALDVGQTHHDLTVEAARPQQRLVQHVGAVGGGDHNHAFAAFKAVHLHQHLVEGLLAFVVATAHAGTTMAADSVDFVDEDDARRVLLGGFEHVTHARCAHAHEHFDKIRTRNTKKRHLGFTRNRACQQGFAGAGRAHHQHATRNLAA